MYLTGFCSKKNSINQHELVDAVFFYIHAAFKKCSVYIVVFKTLLENQVA